MKIISISLLILTLSIPLITGCNQNQVKAQPKQQTQTSQNINGSTQPSQLDNNNRLIHPDAMDQKKINLENVETIELFDLDGKKLPTEFTRDEIAKIIKAYNDSVIDDTAYIEMITGKKMVIVLKDGKKITITSYGNTERVVAAGEDFNYHLISSELAKILLAK